MPNKKSLFQNLHNDHADMVHQVSLGFMKGNQSLAQDLTQEVFINAWAALDKFKGDAAPKTWLYRITVNTCLKYLRDHKDKESVALEDYPKAMMVSTNTAPSSEESEMVLYQAIGQLDELDRLIIMMVLDELAYDKIATITGISEGNLRVKIYRIKKKLKTLLSHD